MRALLTVLFALALSPAPAQAADAPPPAAGEAALTLERAYALAVDADEDLRIARESLVQANLKVDQAMAVLVPSLTATGTLSDQRYDDGSGRDSQLYSLTLEETLWNGGRFFIARRGARGMIRGAQHGIEAARQRLLLDLLDAIYGVLGARDRLAVTAKGVERSAEQRRAAQARFAAGEVARNVVLDALAAEAQARFSQVEADKTLALARRRLALLLGLEAGPDPELPPDAPLPDLDLPSLRDRALRERADVLQSAELVKVAVEQARLAGSYANPELTFSASYNASPDEETMDVQPETQMSLKLRWPFFQGGLVSLQEREARSSAVQEEQRRSQLLSRVELEVEEAVREVLALAAEDELVRSGLESARESHRMARLQFDLGVATGLDVVTAASRLAESENLEVAHRYRVRLARARLLYAVGGLVPEAFAPGGEGRTAP